MRHRTLLEYKKFRYLKLATLVVVASIAAYVWHRPPVGPYGGTWLGYTLGTIAALIILMLLWFGVRKRQYSASAATLQGWLSAHIYLGGSLVVIASLHAGFETGWNVHTLAYVLMLIVIASGFYGIYAYVRLPRIVTENVGDDTLESLLLKISAQDNEARRLAVQLPDDINKAVLAAAQGTRIGGGLFRQLSGEVGNCPTVAALSVIREAGNKFTGNDAKLNHELYAVMLNKNTLVVRARTDIKYKARMTLWLYFHVPLSIALLAALIAHIVSVFFYW